MNREENHVVRHGTERDDDDDPEYALEHTGVDGPIRDFIHELSGVSAAVCSGSGGYAHYRCYTTRRRRRLAIGLMVCRRAYRLERHQQRHEEDRTALHSRIISRLVRLEVEGERAGNDAVRQCPGPERSADEAADLLRQVLQHFDLEPIEVVSHR